MNDIRESLGLPPIGGKSSGPSMLRINSNNTSNDYDRKRREEEEKKRREEEARKQRETAEQSNKIQVAEQSNKIQVAEQSNKIQAKKAALKAQEFQDPNPTSFTNFTEPKREDKPKGSGLYRDVPNRTQEVRKSIDEYTKLAREKLKDPYLQYGSNLTEDLKRNIDEKRAMGMSESDIRESLIPGNQEIPGRLREIEASLKDGREGYMYNIMEGWREKEVQGMISAETVKEINGLPNDLKVIEKWLEEHPEIGQSGEDKGPIDWLKSGTRFALGSLNRQLYDSARHAIKQPETYGWIAAVGIASAMAAPFTGGLSLAVPVTMMGGAAVGTVTSAVGSLGPIGAIKMGMRYGSYDYMAKVEMANSYNEQIANGVDKRIALPIAQTVGAFNGIVEQLQLDAATRMIPGVQTLLDEGSTMVKKELINQSIKVLANYGITVGSEVLEEVLQAGITEYGNVLGEYIQNTPDPTMKGGIEALRKRTTDKEFWDILAVEGYEALKSTWLSPILSSAGRATFQAGQNKLALNRVNNYIAMEDAQSRQVAKNQKDFLIEDGKMTDIAIDLSEQGNESATEFIFSERQILNDIKERSDTTNADKAKIDKAIDKIDDSIGKQMYKTKTVDPTLDYKPTNSVDIENSILDYGFIGSEDVVNPDLTHATVETYKQTIDLGINETIKMELAKGTSKLEIQNIITKALPKKLRNAYQVKDFISTVETIQNEIKGQKVANALYNYNVLHNHNEQQKLNNLNVDAETTETEPTVKSDPVEADLKVETDDVNTNTQQTSEEVATDQEMPLNEVVDEQPIEMGGEIESIDNKVEIDTKEEEYKPSKVVVVPLEKMNLDPERFQFRYDIADDRSLDGIEFDENLAGVVSLWEDEHGDLYVIDGHLRVGKFKEMGINEMNAKIFSYKDMDSDEARAFGAMLNIADGKATAIDVGKVLRDSHITQEKLETYISPKSKIARDGVALSNLNDFLFTQVATKAIPLERAVIIGRELKGNHDGQNQFMKTIRDKESSGANITNAVMTEMLAEVKGTAQEKYIEINMLGEQEMTRNFSVERAEVVSYVKSQLKSKVSLLKNVSKDKNAAMLNELGNKIATEDNVAEMNQADQALFILDKSLNWKGTTTNELFNEFAKEYAAADLKDRAAIKRKALRELVKLMEGGKLLNETINQRTTRQDVKDTISGVIGEGETGATGIGADQQIENQVDFFGQEIVNQLKQEEQIKVINIDEVEGTKVHTETKDIVNAMKNNVFFNGLEVEYSGKSSTRYWTRKELDNAGYRNAKPGRYTTNGFYNPGHQDTLQSKPTRRIVLNDEGDRSTIIEEAIHDIQTRAEEISPKFAVMVKAWEDEINTKAKELGINIPQGKELFAQAYVFTEMGHAEKSNISDLIAMPEDLVEYIEAILGEEILDLARGKIDPKIDKADRKLKSDYKSYALRLFKDKTAMPTIREAQKVRMAEMKVELQNNRAVSYRSPVNSQYVIVSPSVKGSKYQITTFSDRFGPVMDSQHDDLDSVAARLIKDGFTYKVDEVSYQLRQHTRDTVDSIYERAMIQQNFLTDSKNTNIEISTSEIIDLLGDARIGNIAPADFDNLILHNENIDTRTKHDLLDRMLDAVDNGYDAPNSEITFPQYLKRFYGVPIGESQRVSFSSGKHFNTLHSDKTRLRVTNDNKVDVSKIEPTLDKPDIKPVGRFDTVEEAITYYKDNFLVISLMLHSNDIMEKYFTYTDKTMEGLETEYQDFKDNMETFRNKGIETDFTGKPHYAISYQLKEGVTGIELVDESLGYHSGQYDRQLSAIKEGKTLGKLSYSEYNGTPHINYIEVTEANRRQGIASTLLKKLQLDFPGKVIEWGMTTPDGTELRNAITYEVDNVEVQEQLARLETMKAELAEMDQRIAQDILTEEDGERYNPLYDSIAMLEKELRGKTPTNTFIDINYQLKAATDTPEFKNWFKDSKVVDENGKPLVVYHGTTHNWEVYSDSRGNIENDLGKGFYATSSNDDATGNYLSEGPDLTSRVEIRKEQIESMAEYDEYDFIELLKEHLPEIDVETDDFDISELDVSDLSAQIARLEMIGNEETVMEVFLQMEYPFVMDGANGGSQIAFEPNEDIQNRINEIDEQLATEEDEDVVYELEEERQQLEDEQFENAEGEAQDLYNAINELGYDYNVDGDSIWANLSERLDFYGGVSAYELVQTMKADENIVYLESEEGGLAGNQFIQDVIKHMGYDGIIYENAAKHFPKMNMSDGTKHYIAFNPTQIKSIYNNGMFNEYDPNINYQLQETDSDLEHYSLKVEDTTYNNFIKDNETTAIQFSEGKHLESPVLKTNEVVNDADMYNVLVRDAVNGAYDYIQMKDNDVIPVTNEMIEDIMTQGQPLFQLREVENKDGLLAVHNMSESNLVNSLKLGGLPYPSIAITKQEISHENFGEISLIFKKDTIDPKSMKANKVYSRDAYTQTFPEVGVIYDEKKLEKVAKDLNKLAEGTRFRHQAYRITDRIEDRIDTVGLEGAIKEVSETVFAKAMYLLENNIEHETFYKQDNYSRYISNEYLQMFLDMYPGDKTKLNELRFDDTKALRPIMEVVWEEYFRDDGIPEEYISNMVTQKVEKYHDVDDLIYGAYKLANYGERQVVDENKSDNLIQSLVTNEQAEAWLTDKIGDIVIRMGVRNDKERFTPSGNRRSKSALYGPYELDNILRVMKKREETGVDVMFPGINAIAGAAAKTYKSIAEIKADSYKIQDVEYEDMAELSDSKSEELSNITSQMVIGYGESNPFIASDRAKSAIIEIAREPNRTNTYITNELKSWGMNVNDSIVKDIQDFLVSLEELPTRYFEAKPRRGVMFNEVAIAHVPNTIQDTTRAMLEQSGVQLIVEYDPEIEGDRKVQLDNVLGTDEILFQLRETEDTEFKEWFKDSKVVDESGKPLVVYHGGTVVDSFDTARGSSSHMYGNGSYFASGEIAAKEYSDFSGGNLGEYYLSMQSLYNDKLGGWEKTEYRDNLERDLRDKGFTDNDINFIFGYRGSMDRRWNYRRLLDTYLEVTGKGRDSYNDVNILLQDAGYDGIEGYLEGGATQYIVWDPTQIKSTDNRGTWSATDANIYYQLSESLDAEFKPSKWKLTVQNSNLVDPALKALLMSEDLLYEVKRNKYQMLEAAEFIEEKGEAWIYNWITGDLPGTDLMFAAAQLLISKYQQIGEFETAVTLTNAISPKATKLGQAIQILSQVGKETPQGMTRYFSKQLSDTLTGRDLKNIDDKSTDISDTLNDINRDGIQDVDIDGAIDKTKEITPEEMLARRISNTLTSKNKAEKDNLQMMIDTLFAVAKESPLPDNKAIPTNPMVFIIDAIVNRHEYREVWEETKKILTDKFEDNPEQMDMLDDYFNKDIIQTFADSQLKKVMDKELKEMNYKIKDVIKEHYSVGDKLNRTLADKLVSEAGLNPTEAAILVSYIQRDLANRTKDAKDQTLERMFKKNKVTKKEKQTIDAKIIELSNLGAFTNDKFKPLAANLLGLTVMDDELFEYIYKQAEYIQTLEPGREKDKAVALLVKEVSKNVPVSKWEKLATIYAMGHLVNIRTFLRNLLGNGAFSMLDTVTMNYYGVGIDKAMHLLTGRERVTQHRALIDILKTQYSAYFKEFKLGFEDALLGINTFDQGSKYDLRPTRAFGNSQSTNPLIQLADNVYGFIETVMDISMRATDRAAWAAGFADSIQEQLLISGLEVPTEDMIARATEFGLVRTFNDETALSQAFSGIKSNLNKATSYITKQEDFGGGNLAINYPSTPANILSRFIEYSPVGLMQGITAFIGDKTGDEYSRSRNFVESTARGLHGSTIIAIGFVLASLGIITGGGPEGEDPKKLYELKKEAGFKDYAINLTAISRQIVGRFKNPEDGKLQPGDKLTTYDWMDPISLLIATGANVVHTRGNMLGFLGSIAAAFTTGISELTNEPVFTGLSKLFAYGDPAKGATNLVLDLPASLSPQFWSHIANAIDGSNKDAWTGYTKGRQIYNAIIRKIPFAKGQLPDKYDKMGEKMEYYPEDTGVFQRIFRSVINPSIYGEYNPTPTAQLLLELFEETGDARIVPKGMQKSYTIEGEKYTLSPEVNSELSEWIGKEFQTRVTYAMKHYMTLWNTPDQVEEIRFIIKELEDELKEKIYDKGTKLE